MEANDTVDKDPHVELDSAEFYLDYVCVQWDSLFPTVRSTRFG